MTLIAVQYLESEPRGATPAAVRKCLRQACEQLPVALVLLGWDLSPQLEDAVAEETSRQGAQLFRWQPWLTGDARTDLPEEWAVVGPDGAAVPGHGGSSEFTFVCPNHSAVADFLGERLEAIAARGIFQGIFFDRIRFPSPAPDPASHLGCFCRQCARLAAEAGLDLEPARRSLQALLADANGAKRLVRVLLGRGDERSGSIETFLDFRERSVARTVERAARQARGHGLGVGLDCFSPALTRMVGQDLAALDRTCDWIKLMTYPRVLGPAGIPFELLGLADWLIGHYGLAEVEVMAFLAEASGLPVPATRLGLVSGLGSDAVAGEVRRGREAGVRSLLAGIALVDLPGIHESTSAQRESDLTACRDAGAAGLVLSWDLWHIHLQALEIVRATWC